MDISITKSELATVLGALRYYQESGLGDPSNRSYEIHRIATDYGECIPLDDAGIDELCEKLNLGV